MTKDVEKKYKELKKKFDLPGFDSIDEEFEISDLEDTHFLMKSIIRRMIERIDIYCSLIGEIMQPDTSNLSAMHETGIFDEDEKTELYGLYKKLMSFNRYSMHVLLDHDAKSEAKFIGSFFGKWKSIKISLVKHIKKMESSWNSIEKKDEELGYLG
jgi:hypothetical protein